jgi:predicted PurR-regulated permease PerM
VGDRIRLHPVWVIMALLVGGQVGGFGGVLLALPVAAVLEVIAEEVGGWYRRSRLYREA